MPRLETGLLGFAEGLGQVAREGVGQERPPLVSRHDHGQPAAVFGVADGYAPAAQVADFDARAVRLGVAGCTPGGASKLVIDMLVGDLQRVVEYPARGFAVAQDVPADVTDAYQQLIAAGYDSRLMKE